MFILPDNPTCIWQLRHGQGAKTMALPSSILCLALLYAVNGSLTRSCSGDRIEIGLAIQRGYLTQKSRFVFKDVDAGPCEPGTACKLYCTESFLWWDFMELVEVSEHLLDITIANHNLLDI